MGRHLRAVIADAELGDGWGGCRADRPVNAALARIGVEPAGEVDLRADAGLDLAPGMDGWLARGRRGLPPDHYDTLIEDACPEDR